MTIDRDARGRRMVVRHVVGGRGPSGGPAMTDVVGRLVELTDDEARIERRDGSVARGARGDGGNREVVAPPPPPPPPAAPRPPPPPPAPGRPRAAPPPPPPPTGPDQRSRRKTSSSPSSFVRVRPARSKPAFSATRSEGAFSGLIVARTSLTPGWASAHSVSRFKSSVA